MHTKQGGGAGGGVGVGAGVGVGENYEIRVKGHLEPRWADWFDGLSVTPESDGTTVLRGSVVDQAALHGLLGKVRDLGLPLIAVRRKKEQ